MLQDYKLGIRMLLKYPGLTIAGGLALAIAVAIGAGWSTSLHRARQTRPQDQSNRRPAAGLSHSMTRNQGIRA